MVRKTSLIGLTALAALLPAANAAARPDPVPHPVRCVVNHVIFYSYDVLSSGQPGELHISCI